MQGVEFNSCLVLGCVCRVGSFMVRGKRNFVAVHRLEMGVGLAWRLGDDASIARHKGAAKTDAVKSQPSKEDPPRQAPDRHHPQPEMQHKPRKEVEEEKAVKEEKAVEEENGAVGGGSVSPVVVKGKPLTEKARRSQGRKPTGFPRPQDILLKAVRGSSAPPLESGARVLFFTKRESCELWPLFLQGPKALLELEELRREAAAQMEQTRHEQSSGEVPTPNNNAQEAEEAESSGAQRRLFLAGAASGCACEVRRSLHSR